ncbi:TPA: hypothetical protein NKO30_006471 [Pseudomonas aeruginosa]|nr:hypothetical protein [Pseudomonas aeruginosa]
MLKPSQCDWARPAPAPLEWLHRAVRRVCASKFEENTREPDIRSFWSYLWRRFEESSQEVSTKGILRLNSEHISQQKQMEDWLESKFNG